MNIRVSTTNNFISNSLSDILIGNWYLTMVLNHSSSEPEIFGLTGEQSAMMKHPTSSLPHCGCLNRILSREMQSYQVAVRVS